eukprot:PhF_6_TR8171/c0_g1_i1/m.12533
MSIEKSTKRSRSLENPDHTAEEIPFQFDNQDTWKDIHGEPRHDLLERIRKYAARRIHNCEKATDYYDCLLHFAREKLTWTYINNFDGMYRALTGRNLSFHEVLEKYGSDIVGVRTVMSAACLRTDVK